MPISKLVPWWVSTNIYKLSMREHLCTAFMFMIIIKMWFYLQKRIILQWNIVMMCGTQPKTLGKSWFRFVHNIYNILVPLNVCCFDLGKIITEEIDKFFFSIIDLSFYCIFSWSSFIHICMQVFHVYNFFKEDLHCEIILTCMLFVGRSREKL